MACANMWREKRTEWSRAKLSDGQVASISQAMAQRTEGELQHPGADQGRVRVAAAHFQDLRARIDEILNPR